MKLTQMEYFLKVAQRLNYTEAAKELYISQPALSKQIALLEEDLGVKLLNRDNKHVELTAVGEKLKEEMEPLIRRMALVIENVKEMNAGNRAVHVGCFDGLDTQEVLDEVECRLKRAGAIEVEANLYGAQELKARLKSGELDLGIILDFSLSYFGEADVQVLEQRQGAIIFSETHTLAQKKELKAEDFTGHTFLSLQETTVPGAKEKLEHNLRLCGVEPGDILVLPNMLTLASCIDRGQGLAILSRDVIRHKSGRWHAWKLPECMIPLKVLGIMGKTDKKRAVEELFSSYNR